MTDGLRLIRPFTSTELAIGAGIVAGLSYAEMAAKLRRVKGEGTISSRTVRAHVLTMSQKIVGLEDLPPRWAVYTYFRVQQTKRMSA